MKTVPWHVAHLTVIKTWSYENFMLHISDHINYQLKSEKMSWDLLMGYNVGKWKLSLKFGSAQDLSGGKEKVPFVVETARLENNSAGIIEHAGDNKPHKCLIFTSKVLVILDTACV